METGWRRRESNSEPHSDANTRNDGEGHACANDLDSPNSPVHAVSCRAEPSDSAPARPHGGHDAAHEEWVPVVGFEGLYDVSDMGRVRNARTGRILRPATVSRQGHQQVKLSKLGKPYDRLVSRLVLEAFVGPCPPGGQARHVFDPNARNNALSNLMWGTQADNERDKKRHGSVVLRRDEVNVQRRARKERLRARKGRAA